MFLAETVYHTWHWSSVYIAFAMGCAVMTGALTVIGFLWSLGWLWNHKDKI